MTNKFAVGVHLTQILLQLAFLSASPFPSRGSLCEISTVGLALAAHIVGPASSVAGNAQPYALLHPIYLGTLDKFFRAENGNPEESYWPVDRLVRKASGLTNLGLGKIKWAAALMFNTYEMKNVPTKPRMSRSRFLIRQRIMLAYILGMFNLLLHLLESIVDTSSWLWHVSRFEELQYHALALEMGFRKDACVCL